MAAAHVFVSDIEAPELSPDDRHHLERVLRLRPGDEITVCDGAGHWRPCRLAATGGGVEGLAEVRWEEPASPAVSVAFALTKGERPEWTVQKLTEIGVDRIVPFTAARSVVRWDTERAERSVQRLRRVAREAASQSRRAWLPLLDEVSTFADVAARPGAALADFSGGPPSLRCPLVLVGPEGGWSDDERGVQVPRVRLGEHVLRAETAAVVAGALLCGMRSAVVADAAASWDRAR